ncbi:MAG: methyltransferase domain-containing protein, partial [bacterium]|nr:methyltransferase domain-containing protein [bacterium]
PEKYYPLEVCICKKCYLVQLHHVVYPEVMFKDYVYITGASEPMKEHFDQLAADVVKKYQLDKNSLVIDIGSNDGTLLNRFAHLGIPVLGIEPAKNIAELAEKQGVRTLNLFFSEETAKKVVRDYGQADVILATNVFAHVDNITNFVAGISLLLTDPGVFIIEFPYLLNLLTNIEFDTIYHEHLSYLAIHPLVELFNQFKMSIVDIQEIKVHGGSLRIFVQKKKETTAKVLDRYLRQEDKFGIKNLKTYTTFATRVEKLKEELLTLLRRLKSERKKIAGYGAPAKGNTLLNYCNIGTDYIDYIVDATPFKQDKFTPGTHIPIFSETKLLEEFPDCCLLLAWNYLGYVLDKEKKYRDKNGKFIIPIPEPKII